MILIYSDFGTEGPYSGAMRVAAMRHAPGIDVVDLMVDAPDRDPRGSAYLLAAIAQEFKAGDVGLCVIDPGVGSARRGLIAKCDDVWFVGPDNGLFELLLRRAKSAALWRIDWRPEKCSASFHGRDIFGPVAGMLASGTPVERQQIDLSDRDAKPKSWPDDLAEIIYGDGYGNLMTGLRAQAVPSNATISVGPHRFVAARTFSDVPLGDAFWYVNSMGLVEIAVNGGRADDLPGLTIGANIRIEAN